MNYINFIKELKLKLGSHEIIAKEDEFQYLELVDKGIRTYIKVGMAINEYTRDTNGHPITAFGKYSSLKYQMVVGFECRHHIRRIGDTFEPMVQIRGPSLIAVYDRNGVEIRDQTVTDDINCYLEIRQSYSIELSEEFKRQSGRTTRLIKTLKPGEILAAHSESQCTTYEGMVESLLLDNSVKVFTVKEITSMDPISRSNVKIPHEFYEYHKLDVIDLVIE